MAETIKPINGLKGIGAVIIVVYHFGHASTLLEGHEYPFGDVLFPIYVYGYLAVELFFILSGFVAEHSYAQRIRAIPVGTFMKNRWIRLQPLVILTTLIVAVEQLTYFEVNKAFFSYPISLWGLFLTIFGLQNAGFSEMTFNGPAWYVGILLIMYLLYHRSFLCKKRERCYLVYILLGAVIVCCGNGVIALLHPSVGRGLASFFTGVLLLGRCLPHEKDLLGLCDCRRNADDEIRNDDSWKLGIGIWAVILPGPGGLCSDKPRIGAGTKQLGFHCAGRPFLWNLPVSLSVAGTGCTGLYTPAFPAV